MNVYEEAHRLSQAIKESNEYKEFVEVKKDVEANPELKEIVDELLKVQSTLQRKLMSGDLRSYARPCRSCARTESSFGLMKMI